ncbi:MAG TPA: TatD family hydrolase, partial [Spirochaetota bacterium]|nr:TatD family hydrolase [Spirochaetota bacterium]
MLFDSHAHLDMLTDDPGELERILSEDCAGGLAAIVQVSTDPDIHFNIYSKLHESRWNIHFACGLTHAFSGDVKKGLDKLTEIVTSRQVCALGEIGLDFSRGPEPFAMEWQKNLFVEQMAIAQGAGLPVIVHTRDAAAETLAVLDRYQNVRGVAHCFTG